MAHSSSSKNLVPVPVNGVPIRLTENPNGLGSSRQGEGVVRLVGSMEQLTSLQSIEKLRIPVAQQQSYRYPPDADTSAPPSCPIESLTQDAFIVRQYKGKLVRDVWMDTHDLINEPGGYVINLTRHGGASATSAVKSLRIHLGIRFNRSGDAVQTASGNFEGAAVTSDGKAVIHPGTISSTDDYAREILIGILSHPELLSLHAILEIKEADDPYYQKIYPEKDAPGFLSKFMQTIPMSLTKFRVEIPGISGVYLPEWKFLLEQQNYLEELVCNFGVVLWSFYEEGIMKNHKSLKRIVLRRVQTYDTTKKKYVPLDWALFSRCRRLEYLKVTCGYKRQAFEHSCPPTHVFLHENIDELPQSSLFEELHLAKIWVEPCQLQKFCEKRPMLSVCMNCNDQEYYDEDLPATPEEDQVYMTRELRLLQLSRFDLAAVIPATAIGTLEDARRQHENEKNSLPSRSAQKRFGRIVLVLFLAILVALTILFIIMFHSHLRKRGSNRRASPSTFTSPHQRTLDDIDSGE